MTPAVARKIVNYFQTSRKLIDRLTDREKEIAEGIIDGLSYKLIADRLFISIDTVRMHIKGINKKLQINSKGELFKIWKG
jgi:DNA-binding CsgD family transcriptional regulator